MIGIIVLELFYFVVMVVGSKVKIVVIIYICSLYIVVIVCGQQGIRCGKGIVVQIVEKGQFGIIFVFNVVGINDVWQVIFIKVFGDN